MQNLPLVEGGVQTQPKSKLSTEVPSVSWTSSVSSTVERPVHKTYKVLDLHVGPIPINEFEVCILVFNTLWV